ncbi:hypothetical protein [Paenibacillus glucanolyticus]|uniref:hypothetical protein n=1 Tax=Paenibacillus glucanolyticus TaxID=59843 RepID=UPI00096EDDA4|nr:hypothetical protein [Paenibacillus glucanolyticus]OMF76654.1 hypothetical protein BK142_14100 [Paenibacillus glucanolyticus]
MFLKDPEFWEDTLFLLFVLLTISSLGLAGFALSDFTDNQNADLAFSRFQWSLNLFLSGFALAVFSRLINRIWSL